MLSILTPKLTVRGESFPKITDSRNIVEITFVAQGDHVIINAKDNLTNRILMRDIKERKNKLSINEKESVLIGPGGLRIVLTSPYFQMISAYLSNAETAAVKPNNPILIEQNSKPMTSVMHNSIAANQAYIGHSRSVTVARPVAFKRNNEDAKDLTIKIPKDSLVSLKSPAKSIPLYQGFSTIISSSESSSSDSCMQEPISSVQTNVVNVNANVNVQTNIYNERVNMSTNFDVNSSMSSPIRPIDSKKPSVMQRLLPTNKVCINTFMLVYFNHNIFI